MRYSDETWTLLTDKAAKRLEEARFLFDAGFFDGASVLAAGSCMQIAKAISVRLIKDHDPSEWIPRLRQMMKDGRLPADAAKPFFEIIKAHDQELLTSRSRDHKHAMDMIALAETFHRVMSSAADLTAYRQSPEVCQAIAAKGARLPYAPFAR